MRKFNHKVILALLTIGVFTSSCDSYLEEENNTSLSVEVASAYPETFDQLVATVYERARETTTHYTSDLYYALEDLGTDIVTRGSAITGTSDLNDYVDFNSLNWAVGVYWGNQYSVISAANIVVDNADVIDNIDANKKTIGIAEAKFFRALSYFNLVENYGGVPLVLNQVTSASTDYTRAGEEQVYTQIVQDLQDALDGVPTTAGAYGRITKDAVRHFMSKVLLTRGYKSFASSTDFTDAAALAETVIANHPLVSSFASLVSIDNQRNSEVIFSYLFGNNSVSRGWGNSKHMMYKFRFFDYPGLTRTVKGLDPMPTPFFYSLFDDADERAEATYTREIYATEDYVGTVNGADVNVPAGDLAIFFPKTVWTQAEIDAVPYAVINPGTYFTNDGVTPVHYPQFVKFDDPKVPFAQPDQSSQGERDMVIMRSGEAYLIAAEARLESGNADIAANLLTTLRSRAGLTESVAEGDVDLDFILDERARELAGEANRWMDLKRTGKLIERTLLHNPHAALNNALAEKHLLRPIPQNEIDITAGSITQNPGY
ncbi:RagB/SusD family nutrient uptake outer membrane protein [Labilibaculum euxinus]|uniref:RagB/SusD family nutrient uptake outer membrane protein n=1 Tax=Labilibaculum euxinus TaxID=2686357 RepID=A0A7M4D295_9BACT|nr:RagB/SusD family nutrient uptake outer membrane protein [Labilibaculum euxinus]MUP36774.1 RagB/SusD family nutrient uptake outer membrane protein [Labilibaculum euxinus]MVB05979.1 RagB/SusD family nutrient uptake outer membrane protein [Labilibaculum euxinus]